MKRAIDLLRREHATYTKFQDDDAWYAKLMRDRPNEEARAASVEARMADRKELIDQIEDAIELLEEKTSG